MGTGTKPSHASHHSSANQRASPSRARNTPSRETSTRVCEDNVSSVDDISELLDEVKRMTKELEKGTGDIKVELLAPPPKTGSARGYSIGAGNIRAPGKVNSRGKRQPSNTLMPREQTEPPPPQHRTSRATPPTIPRPISALRRHATRVHLSAHNSGDMD